MDDGNGGLVVGSLNVQLNQLDDKPIPYTDLYQYVQIQGRVQELPTRLAQVCSTRYSSTIYDSRNSTT